MFNFVVYFPIMEFTDKQITILETAEKLFADKGFDGTSVRDIADEADINVAMISYYFGSKEKLLESLFTFRAVDTVRILESMLHDVKLTPLEKINRLIDYYIDKFQTQHSFYKIMMREQVADHRNVTSELIYNFKKRNQDLIKQLIHDGQKNGSFKKNIDIPILMTMLIGTISHLFATQHYYKQINQLQDMKDEHFNHHLKKKLSTYLKVLFKTVLTHEA